MTDSQRSKLYRAETSKLTPFSKVDTPEFETLDECKSFVDKVAGYQWFKNRGWWTDGRAIRVEKGRRNSSAFANTSRARLKLPPWSRRRWLILHEIAHVLTPRPFPGHGRLYARTYLELVRYAMGRAEYDALISAFREHNVKYSPFRNPPEWFVELDK